MKLPFRHGLIRWQTDISHTPTFLAKSSLAGDFIDLVVSPDPTIFTVSHGNSNYTIEETKTVTHAWGPFLAVGETQYLYWDISLLNAAVTYGYTLLRPKTQNAPPPNPSVDQHWFDTGADKVMKVWNGGKWVPKLRLFSATYDSSATIIPWQTEIGSQVHLNETCVSGYIILGSDGTPIRDRDGTLLTTETNLIVSRVANIPIKIEAMLFFAQATEYMPKYSLVRMTGFKKIGLASPSNSTSFINGLILEDAYETEVVQVQKVGDVMNEQWAWPESSVGLPLFCGPTGQISLSAPSTGTVQQIGFVTDKDHIFLQIHQPIRR